MTVAGWQLPFLFLVATLCHNVSGQVGSLKTVETSKGTLRGVVISPAAPDMALVVQFLGVPYGEVRSLRGENMRFGQSDFNPRWAAGQVKEALEPAPVCPQQLPMYRSKADAMSVMPQMRYDYMERLQPHLKREQENCLTMNLYVPERIGGGGSSSRKLPILVLVHGDDFHWNAGNPYNGTMLASYGQIIVITLNYRLGVFASCWPQSYTPTDQDKQEEMDADAVVLVGGEACAEVIPTDPYQIEEHTVNNIGEELLHDGQPLVYCDEMFPAHHGQPLLNNTGEEVLHDGQPLVYFDEMFLAHHGELLLNNTGEELLHTGQPMIGFDGMFLAHHGELLLNNTGEELLHTGQPVVGFDEMIMAHHGELLLNHTGEELLHDGQPVVGFDEMFLAHHGELLLNNTGEELLHDGQPVVTFADPHSIQGNASSGVRYLGKVQYTHYPPRFQRFLSACDGPTDCQGNWALFDVALALRAIKKLAAAVDGDPRRITVLGWGSGAALVHLLTASPYSSPSSEGRLFQRAVLLGGSALSPWAMVDQHMVHFYQLVKNVGCSIYKKEARDKAKKTKADILSKFDIVTNCLKEHSVRNLTKAARKIMVPTFLTAFGPTVDGRIVPKHPRENLVQHGTLSRGIDLMVGLTSNEAYHLLNQHDLETGVEVGKQNQLFRTLVRNLYDHHRTEIFDAIVNEYTDWTKPGNDPKTIRNQVLSALGDALYVAPAVQAARLHADGGDGTTPNSNAKTYLYIFNHETRQLARGNAKIDIKGGLRGEDLPYLLGYPLWQLSHLEERVLYENFGVNDRELSKVMMRYLSNYVKSGDPNKPIPLSRSNLVESSYADLNWLTFSESTREAFMHFSEKPSVKEYYRAPQVAFWNKFVPALQGKRSSDEELPKEHHLLPQYKDKKQFFGVVRPYGGYTNIPFVPPPIPPPPVPPGLEISSTSDPPSVSPTPETGEDKKKSKTEYSTILSVTVAVGCALLVLNILIFAGIYHQRDKQKRNKEKMQLHYQSYDASQHAVPSHHRHGNSYGQHHSSPQSHTLASIMPPAPPPPIGSSPGRSNTPVLVIDNDANSLQFQQHHQHQTPPPNTTRVTHHHQQQSANSLPPPSSTLMPHHQHMANNNNGGTPPTMMGRGNYGPEQEPLLGSANIASVGGGGARPGVSPTCPRHGRAALAAMQHQHSSGTVEEIQV